MEERKLIRVLDSEIVDGVFEIPESVTSIGDSAFEDCENLTEISIPEGVTSIGDRAFYGCHNLTETNIPQSVTSIGDGVFRDCSDLTKTNIPDGLREGRKEGYREGILEGESKKAIEIAKQMKQSGIMSETIVKCTGLSEEAISSLL